MVAISSHIPLLEEDYFTHAEIFSGNVSLRCSNKGGGGTWMYPKLGTDFIAVNV